MECNRDAHLIPGKSGSYKAGWVKLCPRIDADFSLLLRKSPRRTAPHDCRSPKPHPIRLTTADAPATRQGAPGDGRQVRQAVVDMLLLDALSAHWRGYVAERSVTGAAERRSSTTRQRVEASERRLVDAVARGDALEALLARLRDEQERKRATDGRAGRRSARTGQRRPARPPWRSYARSQRT